MNRPLLSSATSPVRDTMRALRSLAVIGWITGVGSNWVQAAPTAGPLPFDRSAINRYSLDHLPRSLSIRQGDGVWLGYDLERAKVYKVWRENPRTSGLLAKDFTTKSAGETWYQDAATDTWDLRRGGERVPLAVRYLGVTESAEHFELTWAMSHPAGKLRLTERVERSAAPAGVRASRLMRVEGLAPGDVLCPPAAASESWRNDGEPSGDGIKDNAWHRWHLR